MIEQAGTRLGMTRAAIVAAVRSTDQELCTIAGEPPASRLLTIECGTSKLTALLTDADKAWSVRTSLDLAGSPADLVDARAALIARYGAPTGTANEGSTLIWLPGPVPAGKAEQCWGEVTLLSSAVESGTPGEAAAPVDPACLPLRIALLSAYQGHQGVVVETQDPRPRLDELKRATPER